MEAFTPFAAMQARVRAGIMACMPDRVAALEWDATRIAAVQRDGLRALIDHARRHAPFHTRRLAAFDPATIELDDLRALPVMTKADLMDAFDDVVTDRRLTRATCEAALAVTSAEPQPLYDAFVCMSSGGSSGRRGVFVLDVDAMVDVQTAVQRYGVRRMLTGAAPPVAAPRLALVAAASAVHATGAAASWASGGPIALIRVPATLPIATIVEQLNALQPTTLMGYPSILARLARERREGRLAITPGVISCTSENLLPEWRAAIREAFGAPIANTFGSTEGLFGASDPDEEPINFNSDSCIVEPVDDAGNPVPIGVPSARILLTNLSNRVQPLIRYEINDRFVRHPPAASHGHLRATVEGRADEFLRWGSVEVHPLVIRSVLVKTAAVDDYQVRQTPRGVAIDVVAFGPLDAAALRVGLAEALAGAGLPHAEVAVRQVAGVARQADTAKLRRFIPL